jgi:PAS domain S-box-containing protein
MMKIIIEVSGAERGLLLLEKKGKYFIEAEGGTDIEDVRLLQNVEVTKSGKLSLAVVNYVIRTKENIILKEAGEEELFQNDPYIIQNRPKSLLCAPIVHQGKVKGIIYLENNLTGGAFTEERVEIVRLIAFQAATSLENARLYQSLLVDIERRKEVEEELRRSEEMARSLLDALKDSLVLIDTEGTVLNLNRTTARSLGIKSEEAIGRCLWEMLPNEVAERRRGFVKRAVRSGRAIRVVDEQDGKVSDNVIYPVVDSLDRVTRIAILERDITEQRKVKQQAEIQQQHLVRSDRLAMMGELAAGVAHEINNPNHSIMLNTALLLKAYPDILSVLDRYDKEEEGFRIGGLEYSEFRNTIKDTVKRIEECAKRIGVIVNELKSFARLEPEDISESVDINITVQSAIVLGTPFIKKSTDNFTVQIEEKLPKVRGSAQKIEQVLLNLLQNACQSLHDKSSGVSIGAY